ncbi:MAG: prolyl oligopeptidase family serine peptidase [Deltaproteobacteria bacterium]|nr:prolyl oligopeptidase family serine peptidase [Deltaproteobacteria bacterium]
MTDAPTAASTPSAEDVSDPHFPETWALTSGFRLGHPTAIRITPEGDQVLFLRSGARDLSRALYSFDVATGEERELLTAERLLGGADEELSPEEAARRERLRMTARGIGGYELSPDGKLLLIPLSGQLFVYDRESGAVRTLPHEGGYALDAHFSPDGAHVACVREGDLYVIDLAHGRQRRLTRDASEHVTNGLPEFVAAEEMARYRGYWWSPDSDALVYQSTDTSGVETLYAADPSHPERPPRGAPYPRAGKANAVVTLHVLPIRGGRSRELEWDRETFPYLAKVDWTTKGIYALVQDRVQRREKLLRFDPRTRESVTLLEERDAAWLNLDASVPAFVGDDGSFLWSTERNGAYELELRGPDGALVRRVTEASLGYRAVEHVDSDGAHVWVLGDARSSVQHVYRVPITGEGAPAREGDDDGWAGATFGKSDDVHVRVEAPVDGAPRALVVRGEETHELRSVAEAPSFLPTPEYMRVGERELEAVVYRPRNFVVGQSYPVILSVYGGPGFVKVRHALYGGLRDQWLADHGAIVLSVDGRGTPHRGRDFERAIVHDLITIPLDDQIAGLRGVAERVPEMDLSRVGVFGWSFGGYFSAMAVIRAPEVFRVAVAGAPVTDWRDYDTHYTERFMGLPSENAAGYDSTSAVVHAAELTRPLLLIHGTSDDNVYFVHTLKLANALLLAGRDFSLVPLPGSTHMVADPAAARALQERIARFLFDHLR